MPSVSYPLEQLLSLRKERVEQQTLKANQSHDGLQKAHAQLQEHTDEAARMRQQRMLHDQQSHEKRNQVHTPLHVQSADDYRKKLIDAELEAIDGLRKAEAHLRSAEQAFFKDKQTLDEMIVQQKLLEKHKENWLKEARYKALQKEELEAEDRIIKPAKDGR